MEHNHGAKRRLPQQKLPDTEILRRLVDDDGLTDAEIAGRYGVSAEAVRLARAKAGIDRVRIRPDHRKYIPWHPRRSPHNDSHAYKMLAVYSKKQQGKPVTRLEEERLEEWLAWMDGANKTGRPLSVWYDLNKGFYYKPRRPEDNHYIHYQP